MKIKLPLGVLLLLCLGLTLGVGPVATPAQAETPSYVCPPCGLPCDKIVHDKPGTCPGCHMQLVDRTMVHARPTVGILVFNGVEIIDYTGPYEIFMAAGFDVYTVAATREPVTTAGGMVVVPKHTFADAPQPDVLVVPGGSVREARKDAPTLKWVSDVTGRGKHTMSVCNGAFILASAGLLDGLTATTTAHNIEDLTTSYPKTRVVDDQRYVDNGKIITTAGLSAGIDGALHVVAVMLGTGQAQAVALGEEYDWRPDGGFARAALADRLIPRIDMDSIGTWNIASTQGGTDRWELVLEGRSDLSPAQVLDFVNQGLVERGKWTSVAGAAATPASTATAPLTSAWKFRGRDGDTWTGTLSIESQDGEHRYRARLRIARAG